MRWIVGLLSLLVATQATAQPVKIVALGTSFTAGRFVPSDQIWTTRLQQLLQARSVAVELRNQGVNGDTTRNLMARLDHAVPQGTSVVILEFSWGNDSERGISQKETIANVETMVSRLLSRTPPPRVLLLIRGFGDKELNDSVGRFRDYLAATQLPYLPINQTPETLVEGRHPNAAGHMQVAQAMAPIVLRLLGRAPAGTSTTAPAK